MSIYDDFAEQAVAVLRQGLGPNLNGAYKIGSLAHGGFSPRYSDIDLALVVRDAGAAADVLPALIEQCRLLDQSLGQGQALGPLLSVFWGDQELAGGRFPILDQVDFCDHRVVVFEQAREARSAAVATYEARSAALRPGLPVVRTYLLGHPIDYWRDQTRRYGALPELRREDEKEFVRCLLYPARLVYTWVTGALTSNDEAVSFLASHLPPGVDLDLVQRALECRTQGREPATLFARRGQLHDQLQACLDWVGRPVGRGEDR